MQVRKAFTADVSKGHPLVVADYGQLELRILAHLASCTSMIRAFELGGDFHSRTALGMYDHIKEAIDKGKLDSLFLAVFIFGRQGRCLFPHSRTLIRYQTNPACA